MFYFKKGHVVCVFGNMREKMMSSKYLEDWILINTQTMVLGHRIRFSKSN